MFTLDILVPLLAALPLAKGLVRPDGVGKLPALGWNSWNAFNCNITESDFLTAANQIVSLGLKVRLLLYLRHMSLTRSRMLATNMLTSTTVGLSRAAAMRKVKLFRIRQSSLMAFRGPQTRSTQWALKWASTVVPGRRRVQDIQQAWATRTSTPRRSLRGELTVCCERRPNSRDASADWD